VKSKNIYTTLMLSSALFLTACGGGSGSGSESSSSNQAAVIKQQ
jgi:hypothetical protein